MSGDSLLVIPKQDETPTVDWLMDNDFMVCRETIEIAEYYAFDIRLVEYHIAKFNLWIGDDKYEPPIVW